MPIGIVIGIAAFFGGCIFGAMLFLAPKLTAAILLALLAGGAVWPWIDRRLDAFIKRFLEW